jgi:hypothetical protein
MLRGKHKSLLSLMVGNLSPLNDSCAAVVETAPNAALRQATLGRLIVWLVVLSVLQAITPEVFGRHVYRRPDNDLAVKVNPAGGYALFASDGLGGGIYFKEIEAKKDVELWDLQSFIRLELKGPQIPQHPTGLAVHGTSLYVLDKYAEAVFVVDLETYGSRLLLRKPVISKPLSIAVSDSGLLAIGQDDQSVMVYDPAKPDTHPVLLPGTVDEPLRMQFIPVGKRADSLLVLDADHSDHLLLYEPATAESGAYILRQIQVPPDVHGRLEQRSDATLDCAFASESFYLTEGYNWAIFSLNGLTSARWMIFPDMYKVSPERLRSVGDDLFVLDSAHRRVLRLSLSLMTLRIETNASDANAFLADLYHELWDKGALPERNYRVPNNNRVSLLELLKLEHVLAPASEPNTFTTPGRNSIQTNEPKDKLENTLCLLNKRLNGWECSSSPPAVPKQERLSRQFGQGQALVIPGLGVEETRYESSEYLTGRSVEETVKDRLMTDNPHESVSAE